jgi:hypothetical protein
VDRASKPGWPDYMLMIGQALLYIYIGERQHGFCAHVIFVHGLGGIPTTRSGGGGPDEFWPAWLAGDVDGVAT